MTHLFSTPKPGMGSQTRNGLPTPPVASAINTPPETPRNNNSMQRSHSTPILSSKKSKQTSEPRPSGDSFRRNKSFSHLSR
jgi:hypothetical protein